MRNPKRLETPKPLTMNELQRAVTDVLSGKVQPVRQPQDLRPLFQALGQDTRTMREQIREYDARLKRLSIPDEPDGEPA